MPPGPEGLLRRRRRRRWTGTGPPRRTVRHRLTCRPRAIPQDLQARFRLKRRIRAEAWRRAPEPGVRPGPTGAEREVRSSLKRGWHAPWLANTYPIPLLAVAQLYRKDVPGLFGGPADCDVLQMFWCPFDSHRTGHQLALHLRWRRSADVCEVLAEQGWSRSLVAKAFAVRSARTSTGRWVSMSTRTVTQVRPPRTGYSSTPRRGTRPDDGTGSARMSRSRVSRHVVMARRPEIRPPAGRPGTARRRSVSWVTSAVVRRACRNVRASICPANVRRPHRSFPHTKRSARRTSRTRRPYTGRSAQRRR
ncbi:hypothetical protein SAMN05216371_0219 [Streptomyces sp. TLI_053]|nr:hypothetical protein SAMN05216371_0219 [Streptomyces sp. TLI_053]